MVEHDGLIDLLAASAQPVRRSWPSGMRTLVWALFAVPAGLVATSLLHHGWIDWSEPGALLAGSEIVLAFCLGLGAIAFAFEASIAGRDPRGAGTIGLGALVWLAASFASIALSPNPIGHWGSGTFCYAFILLAGVPMMAGALIVLRRTRSLRPGPTLLAAGGGIAFLALGLLGFCHPATGQAADFLGHMAGAASIVGLTLFLGRPLIAA
jgi:hypothetical protein